jgi:hypothetical protein
MGSRSRGHTIKQALLKAIVAATLNAIASEKDSYVFQQ